MSELEINTHPIESGRSKRVKEIKEKKLDKSVTDKDNQMSAESAKKNVDNQTPTNQPIEIDTIIANDTKPYIIKMEESQKFLTPTYKAIGVGRFGPGGAWADFNIEVDLATGQVISLKVAPSTLRANAISAAKVGFVKMMGNLD